MLSSDATLVGQTLHGSRNAFASLVDRYQSGLLNRALSEVGNRSEAEDIVQEAFLHAYQHLEELREPDKFGGWIYRTTCNLCHDAMKKRRLMFELFQISNAANMPNRSVVSCPFAEAHESAESLIKALEALPDNNKEVFLLYLEGWSYQKIAMVLSLSTSTVSGRIQLAKQQLRAALSHNPDFASGSAPLQMDREYLREEIDRMFDSVNIRTKRR